jgi:hypothetical protein
MNFRHAAAFALVGWYLMTPPMSRGDKYPQICLDESAPLSSWSMSEAFDTAAECENFRIQLGMPHKPQEGHTLDEEKQAEKMFQQSNCVASDDTRLRGN